MIVQQAKDRDFGIVMEQLTGLGNCINVETAKADDIAAG
jgi:hypothetical protein